MIKLCPCCGEYTEIPDEFADLNIKASAWKLLYILIRARGRLVKKEALGPSVHLLRYRIRDLRAVLRDKQLPWQIHTVQSLGYQLMRKDVLQRQRTEGCAASREGSPAQGGSTP